MMPEQKKVRVRLNINDARAKMRELGDLPYNRTINKDDDIDRNTAFLDASIYKRLCAYRDSELSLALLAKQLDVRRQTVYGWLREDRKTRITKANMETIRRLAFDLNACVTFQRISVKKEGDIQNAYVAFFQGYLYDEEEIQRQFLYYWNPELKYNSKYRGHHWDASLKNTDAIKKTFHYDRVGAAEITESGKAYREYKYKLLKDWLDKDGAPKDTTEFVQIIPGHMHQVGYYTSHKELKSLVYGPKKDDSIIFSNISPLNDTQLSQIRVVLDAETRLIQQMARTLVRKTNRVPGKPKELHTIPVVQPHMLVSGTQKDILKAIERANLFMRYKRYRPGLIAMTLPTDKYMNKGYTQKHLIIMDTDTKPNKGIKEDDRVVALVNGTIVMGLFSRDVKNPDKVYINRWKAQTGLGDEVIWLKDLDFETPRNYTWMWKLVDKEKIENLFR